MAAHLRGRARSHDPRDGVQRLPEPNDAVLVERFVDAHVVKPRSRTCAARIPISQTLATLNARTPSAASISARAHWTDALAAFHEPQEGVSIEQQVHPV